MSKDAVYEGGCLCGDIRFRGSGDPFWVGHCHCERCQKASGAAFLTYIGFRPDSLAWTKGFPKLYESSPGIQRGFCPTCGSTLCFQRPDKGEISVFAGVLDRPKDIEPTFHLFCENEAPWLKMRDDLPRFPRFGPGYEDREMEGP